jgi:N6-L-threonylcarbamoyladenine synthase
MSQYRKLILGIETSCDETSAAVIGDGRIILSNIISSQIDIHSKYGGVVPEIASRKHVELIIPVIDDALKTAGVGLKDIDLVGVTSGPGLVGALLVGISAAKSLAYSIDRPLIGVHHISGHISANYLENADLKPPFIALVVSGGHSHIIHVRDYGIYEILGQTRDDAAGEAFDKIARALGLGYPGGPLIDKIAKDGERTIKFPEVSFGKNCLDFSFSGIKTSVLNYLNTAKSKGENINICDVAASFQGAVVDVLVRHTMIACDKIGIRSVALAGGVASNSALRDKFKKEAAIRGLRVCIPSPVLCTDNAAMIASAAYFEYLKGFTDGLDLNADPGMKFHKDI